MISHNRRKIWRVLSYVIGPFLKLVAAGALLSILAVAGCDHSPATPPTPSPQEPLRVLATAYPLGDVVRRVGGRAVHVEWLVESGQSMDSIEMTSELRNRLRSADLVVSGGGSSESWATEGSADALQTEHVLRLDLLETAGGSHQVAAQMWLDPLIMREFIGILADRLGTLRPGELPAFRKNADALISQIDSALAEHRSPLDHLAGRKVITLSPEFSALASRFGLVEIRPVQQQSPLRLSDLDLARMRQAAREQGARCLLLSADVPPQVVEDLANRTSLNVLTLDSLGTSATGPGHASYISLLQYNLGQLASIR